jgi:DNA replication protein DnaC
VYFTSIRRYIRDLQTAMHSHEAQERNIEEIVLNAPVLILDDLGAEDGSAVSGKKHISDWAIGKIFDLLEERLSKGLTTYITSNNDPAALLLKWRSSDSEVQDQAGRIYERLIRHFTSIPVM